MNDGNMPSLLTRTLDEPGRIKFLRKRFANLHMMEVKQLSEEDTIIAVMGPTGTGKSSFISKATGYDEGGHVGHDLMSCTTDIRVIKFQSQAKSDLDIVLVDTPGFDDTNKTDVEILNMIANWLKNTYQNNVKLAGILYFHRISDNRMAGTPLKNLRMFEQLCGSKNLSNITLVTTMWDEIDLYSHVQEADDAGRRAWEKEKRQRRKQKEWREKELRENYWGSMIKEGSKTTRYWNTSDSAWEVLKPILQVANNRFTVRLQKELVDMKRQLPETRAGKTLYATIEVLIAKQREMLRKLREEEIDQRKDETILYSLKEEYDCLRKELETTLSEIKSLEISMSRRLFIALTSPLGILRGGVSLLRS